MTTRRDFLVKLPVVIGACAAPRLMMGEPRITAPRMSAEPGLKDFASTAGLYFGSQQKGRILRDDPFVRSIISRECSVLTSGYDFRWDKVWANQEQFDFGTADVFADWTRTNNIAPRGHPIVWHQSLPPWVQRITDRATCLAALEGYAQKVVTRYATRVRSWDAVNEAIRIEDGRSDGLRRTQFLALLGQDYVDTVFRTVRAAAPSLLLSYNETGLEYRSGARKRVATLRLLERLVRTDAGIKTFGVQGHLEAGKEKFDQASFRTFLADVAALGLPILITELDVADSRLPRHVASRDQSVADAYEEFLDTALDEAAVVAVITWGLADHESWLVSYRPRDDGAPVRPLLFDSAYQRKKSWFSVARALQSAPKRTPIEL